MKKLLTLLLVAAMAVASFGVLTACGDKSGGGGGNETTTSSTLEGEWYYTIDNYVYLQEMTLRDQMGENEYNALMEMVSKLPEISADTSLSIRKLTAEEKAEQPDKDYMFVFCAKYNVASFTLTDEQKGILNNMFGEITAGDGNVYALSYGETSFFAENAGGDYSEVFGEYGIAKAEYKDGKFHVVIGKGEQAVEADWNYRVLGAKPDVAGTWSDNDPEVPFKFTAVTEGEEANTIFIGKYAVVVVPELYDEEVYPEYYTLFEVGNDMMCTMVGPAFKVTRVSTAA